MQGQTLEEECNQDGVQPGARKGLADTVAVYEEHGRKRKFNEGHKFSIRVETSVK